MQTVRSPAQAVVFVPAHGTILNSFGVQEQIREFGYNWKDQNLKSLDYPMIDFSNTFSQAMHKRKQGDYISRLPNSCIKIMIKIMVLWIKKSSIAWDELFYELPHHSKSWSNELLYLILKHKHDPVALQFAQFARVVRHSRCRGVAGGLTPLWWADAAATMACARSCTAAAAEKWRGWDDPWKTM